MIEIKTLWLEEEKETDCVICSHSPPACLRSCAGSEPALESPSGKWRRPQRNFLHLVMARYQWRACKRWKHSLPGSETEGVKRSGEEEDWTMHRAVSFAVKPNKHNAEWVVHFYVTSNMLYSCMAWWVFEQNAFHVLSLVFSFFKRTLSIPVIFTSIRFANTYGRKMEEV